EVTGLVIHQHEGARPQLGQARLEPIPLPIEAGLGPLLDLGDPLEPLGVRQPDLDGRLEPLRLLPLRLLLGLPLLLLLGLLTDLAAGLKVESVSPDEAPLGLGTRPANQRSELVVRQQGVVDVVDGHWSPPLWSPGCPCSSPTARPPGTTTGPPRSEPGGPPCR